LALARLELDLVVLGEALEAFAGDVAADWCPELVSKWAGTG
jgi:hypothetical protein